MGEQFVCGQTIEAAIHTARRHEAEGFRYSYDMLGEAAATAPDAARYLASYSNALDAIGAASAGRGIYEGPGLSIKLSALHPRYQRAQRRRVMEELLPRLKGLVMRARRHDVGVNIDAEESERLDLSLDLLDALCRDPDLGGWNGVGFVVQAYQKRTLAVVDFIVDLARRTRRRIMVRLVKGAYWDSEIKRAQVEGLEGFPVFTRRFDTDVSYIACARLSTRRRARSTRNSPPITRDPRDSSMRWRRENFYAGQYGVSVSARHGRTAHQQVVGPAIEPPVPDLCAGRTRTKLCSPISCAGSWKTAATDPSSIASPTTSVPVEALLEDPADLASALILVGAPILLIALPRDSLEWPARQFVGPRPRTRRGCRSWARRWPPARAGGASGGRRG